VIGSPAGDKGPVRRRTKAMRTALVVPLAVLLFAQGACGAEDRPTAGSSVTDKAPTTAAQRASELYEANAMVLEADEGPMLCLGGMRLSLPPQCGDVPIVNWDWETVGGEESMAGTTWGRYHVVGAYDGETFTVTEVGPFQADGLEPETDLSSPCPEPEGGWPVPDPGRSTQEHARKATAYASSQPDYVASWVTQLDEEQAEFGPVVFNAVFTGAVTRHEAALREVWEGPLCVVQGEGPTAKHVRRIRDEVEASLGGLGLRMLWSQGPGVDPTIEIGVVADPAGAGQSALDERYGSGLVRLFPALRPVP
jgi:hypothetical protein